MNAAPAVSVVVATHDRPKLLAQALAAIRAQRYPGPIEVIAVFDRTEPDTSLESSDPTRTVRVVRNTRSPGLAGARNTGIGVATGEIVAFCDDDDMWLPGKLAEQVAVMRQVDGAIACVCGIVIDYEGRRAVRVPRADELTTEQLLRRRVMAAHPSTLLVDRAALDRVGLVDEEIPGSYAEDYDWLLRIAAEGPVAVAELPLVRVRWGATSYFADRWALMARAIEYLVEKHPEFRTCPRGLARLWGRRSFALAAAGEPDQARALARETLILNPFEARAYLALAVSFGVVSPSTVTGVLNRRGRGI